MLENRVKRKSKCINCGTLNRYATAMDDKAEGPAPGDCSICIVCGSAAMYDDDLKLRPPTEEETRQIDKSIQVKALREAWARVIKK